MMPVHGREQSWALKAPLQAEGGLALDLLIFNNLSVLEHVIEALPEVTCSSIMPFLQHCKCSAAAAIACTLHLEAQLSQAF